MLRLSKKSDYALMAMRHLVSNAGRDSSAREIAEAYSIPVELLAKVLQQLARKKLVDSHQGTRGGYRLARQPTLISVADVIQAIDGPLTMTACSTGDERCDQFDRCGVRDPLWRIKDRILLTLATCSVLELATDEPPPPVVSVEISRVHKLQT